MDTVTWVDGVVLGICLVSAFLGMARGMVREIMTILAWIAALFVAFFFAPALQPLVTELPYVGTYLEGSCELSMILSYIVVFTISLAVISLFSPLLSTFIRGTSLDKIDRALGFIFGFARGLAIVIAGLYVYTIALPSQGFPEVDNSKSNALLGSVVSNVSENDTAAMLGWVTYRYENIIGACEGGGSTA